MMEVALRNNLKQLLRDHGNLSVTELARATKVPQPTVHNILSGTTTKPQRKTVEALSNFFHVSINQLMGIEPLPIKSVPIIQWSALLKWPLFNEEKLNYNEISVDRLVGVNSFAFVLEHSLMEFPQNSLLIFDSTKTPKDRDFIVVLFGRDNSLLFNKFFIEDSESYIKQPLSDGNFKFLKLDKIDRILGTLIEVRIQY